MFLIPGILSIIAQFVPSLLGSLAGKNAADVAQKVIAVAQVVTGTSTQEAAADALKADPSKLSDLQVKLAQIALEAAQAEYADVNDARSMEKQALQSGSLVSWVPYVFTLIVLGVWVSATMGWVPHLTDVDGARMDTLLTMVMGFIFGHQRATSTDNLLANSVPQSVFQGVGLKNPLG